MVESNILPMQAGEFTAPESESHVQPEAAISSGRDVTVGPFSVTAVVIAVEKIARACSGFTTRPMYRAAVSKNLYGFNSSNADVSISFDSTSPATAITGAPSLRASAAH